jgi:hypothetical protein
MKLVSIFSFLSLASTLAFSAGLAFNVAALPLFAMATAAFVLLTWVNDYRAPRDYAACTTIALRPCQPLPLAA